jgi:hypothetical protein
MKENLVNTKYKFSFQITSIKSMTEMKGILLFQEHWLNFKITDANGKTTEEKLKKKDIFKNILKPVFYSEAEDSFYLNYSLIKSISLVENRINLEIFNPANPISISIIMFKVELVGMVFNKNLNFEGLTSFTKFIKLKISTETKHLIEQFLLFFNVLKEGLYSSSSLKQSDDRILKCLTLSKKYYEKNIVELKKQEKIKSKVIRKIFNSKEDVVQTNVNKTIVGEENQKEANLSNNSNISNNLSNNNSIFNFNNNVLSSILPDGNSQYCSFEYIYKEIKGKTINLIENSIILFFQIASLEMTIINFKNLNKEKVSSQLRSINQYDTKIQKNASINLYKSTSNQIANNRSLDMNRNILNVNTSFDKKNMNRSINIANDGSNILNQLNRGYNEKASKGNNILQDEKEYKDINSTKTSSMKDKESESSNKKYSSTQNFKSLIIQESMTVETPKFCGKNLHPPVSHYSSSSMMKQPQTPNTTNTVENRSENLVKENLSYPQILKKIEDAKLEHAFMPTNDYYNVFHNTLEIAHRKFFELSFEDFFPKIFTLEKDSNNLIKLDSIYNQFIYLRGLKNLLFTEKNKIFFSNVFFDDDD